MKLSSDHLYHFTRKPEFLLSILKNGFEHRELTEELPLTGYKGSVFSFEGIVRHQFKWSGVCFCDIPEHTIADHSEQYGAYGICMNKLWGISNGLTPIRYVHYRTPDLHKDEFYSIKDSLSTIRANGGSFFMMIAHMLDQIGKVPLPTQEEFDAYPEKVKTYFKQIDSEILPMLQHPMRYLGLLRQYEGEWTDRVTGKKGTRLFYDEKEWRALQVSRDQGNLLFDATDVEAVLFPNKSELDNFINKFEESEEFSDEYKSMLLGKMSLLQDHVESESKRPKK